MRTSSNIRNLRIYSIHEASKTLGSISTALQSKVFDTKSAGSFSRTVAVNWAKQNPLVFHLSRGFNFNFVSPLFSYLLHDVHMENKRRPSLLVTAAAYLVIYKTTNLHNFDSSVLSYSASRNREGKNLAKEVTNLQAAETVLVFPSPALVYPEMEIT